MTASPLPMKRPFYTTASRWKRASYRRCLRSLLLPFCAFVLLFLLLLPRPGSSEEISVKIGVLAYRGLAKSLEMWSPTAAYLTAKLPRHHVTIVPLSFDAINKAVERGEVDFVLANSAIYVELESRFGANRILTLKNRRLDGDYAVFGGVIFVRNDRTDINRLSDLRGRSFMAVTKNSFGGWIMAWRELQEQGIDPFSDFSSLNFGGTHDAVVYAVRDGDVDAGTVRTDTLERMEKEKKIDMREFRVIDVHLHSGEDARDLYSDQFPFLLSTRLYPEWPIAKVHHTSDELAKQVAIALLQMPKDSQATRAAGITGWLPPLDYQPVHECLRELQVGPYQHLGHVTPSEVVRKYWHVMLFALLALLSTSGAALYVQKLNRRLRHSHEEVERARNGLEVRVEERTQELQKANVDLQQEVADRERAEVFTKGILEAIGEGLIAVDREFRILAVNETAQRQVNLPANSIIGKTCHQIFHHLDRPCHQAGVECAVKYTFESGMPGSVVHIHQDAENEPVYMEMRSYPMQDRDGAITSVIETLNDITERRKLEAQLLQAQKMEAVGRLAGGVAHDFNNILTAIMGYTSLLQARLGSDEQALQYASHILSSSERAAHLTRSLLAFSRKQIINPRPIKLSEVIERVQSLLSRVIGEDIELRIFLSEREVSVMADPGQIEQVLMNLSTNARDAMAEGGMLLIETELVQLDEQYVRAHDFGQAGTYMVLSVTDTGAGLAADTKERIFEPFFTTKEVGRGSGLGLSIAYGIVKQHNGQINVYSDPGRGTTFRIYLPVVDQEAEALDIPPPAPVIGGTETILFAEDDEFIRELALKVLEDGGYTVVLARDGEEALELFMAHSGSIDLVALDVIMPRKNGREVYQAIRERSPSMRALFLSGYTADIIHRKGFLEEGLAFLAKPFSPASLLRKMREVLDKEAPA